MSASRPDRSLPPGKTRYPLYRRLGGPQGQSVRVENLSPTGIRSSDRPALSQSLYRIRYPACSQVYSLRNHFVCDSDVNWAVVTCVFNRYVDCSVTFGADYIIWNETMVLNGKLIKLKKAALLTCIQVLAQNLHVMTAENHKRDTQTILPWVRNWS